MLIGIVCWIVGYGVLKGEGLGLAVGLVGTAGFIFGCIHYALGKGYHWAVGLLGILGCIGLIVMIVLPDKNKA